MPKTRDELMSASENSTPTVTATTVPAAAPTATVVAAPTAKPVSKPAVKPVSKPAESSTESNAESNIGVTTESNIGVATESNIVAKPSQPTSAIPGSSLPFDAAEVARLDKWARDNSDIVEAMTAYNKGLKVYRPTYLRAATDPKIGADWQKYSTLMKAREPIKTVEGGAVLQPTESEIAIADKYGARLRGVRSPTERKITGALEEETVKSSMKLPDIDVKSMLVDAEKVRRAKEYVDQHPELVQTMNMTDEQARRDIPNYAQWRIYRDMAEKDATLQSAMQLKDRTVQQIVSDAAKRYGTDAETLTVALNQRDVPIGTMLERMVDTDDKYAIDPDKVLYHWSQRTGNDANSAGSASTAQTNLTGRKDLEFVAMDNLNKGRLKYIMTDEAGLMALDPTLVPQVNTPGEQGYAIAQQIVENYAKTGGAISWWNPMEQTHRGYLRFLQDRVKTLTRREGVSPGDPNYDAVSKAALNRAIAELAAAKTVGLWTSAAHLPETADPDQPSFADAVLPSLEIIGISIRRDGSLNVVTRQESRTSYVFNTMMIAQSAASGALRHAGDDTTQMSTDLMAVPSQFEETKEELLKLKTLAVPLAVWSLATGKTDQEVAAKYVDLKQDVKTGILSRDNLMSLAMESDWAKPTVELDPTTGTVERSGDWKMWIAGTGGLAGMMFFPDVTDVVAGFAGDAIGGIAQLSNASKAKRASAVLDDITAYRAAADNLYRRAQAEAEFAKTAGGMTASHARGRALELRLQADTAWRKASAAESDLRESFPQLADELDRIDASIANGVAAENPNIFDKKLAERLPVQSSENVLLTLHPSERRSALKTPEDAGFQYDYKRLYDTDKVVRAIEDIEDIDKAGGRTAALVAESKDRLQRLRGIIGDAGVKNIVDDLPAAIKDPEAWRQLWIDGRKDITVASNDKAAIEAQIRGAIDRRIAAINEQQKLFWSSLTPEQEVVAKRATTVEQLKDAGIDTTAYANMSKLRGEVQELRRPGLVEELIVKETDRRRALRRQYIEEVLSISNQARNINRRAADYEAAVGAVLTNNETRSAAAEVLRLRLRTTHGLSLAAWDPILKSKGIVNRAATDVYRGSIPAEALPKSLPLLPTIGAAIKNGFLGLTEEAYRSITGGYPVSRPGRVMASKFRKHFGLSKEQSLYVAAIVDSVARGWAKANGSTVDKWYKSHISDIVNGFIGESRRVEQASKLGLKKSDQFIDYWKDLQVWNTTIAKPHLSDQDAAVLEGLRKKHKSLGKALGPVDVKAASAKWLKDHDARYAGKMNPRVKKQLARGERLFQEDGYATLLAESGDISKLAVPDGFFSPLQRAIGNVIKKNGGRPLKPSFLLKEIRKQPGVKEEEILWSGIEEFLAGKERVGIEDVSDWLKRREPIVEVRGVGLEGSARDASRVAAATELAAADQALSEIEAKGRSYLSRLALREGPDYDKFGVLDFVLKHADEMMADPDYYANLQAQVAAAQAEFDKLAAEAKTALDNYSAYNSKPMPSYRDFAAYSERAAESNRLYEIVYNARAKMEAAENQLTAPFMDLERIDSLRRSIDLVNSSDVSLREGLRTFVNDSWPTAWQRRVDAQNALSESERTAQTLYDTYIAPGKASNYREIRFLQPGSEGPGPLANRHFEKNAIAHLRTTDRIDDQGRKILFIEEAQSDWHQAGVKHGYTSQEDAQRLTLLRQQQRQLAAEEKELEAEYELIDTEDFSDAAGVNRQNLMRRIRANRSKQDYTDTVIRDINVRGGVARGTHSELWRELAVKQALAIAAKEGYDGVAITRGPIIQAKVGGDFAGQVEFYDTILPSVMKSAAKSAGAPLETTGVKFGLQIDEAMTKEIVAAKKEVKRRQKELEAAQSALRDARSWNKEFTDARVDLEDTVADAESALDAAQSNLDDLSVYSVLSSKVEIDAAEYRIKELEKNLEEALRFGDEEPIAMIRRNIEAERARLDELQRPVQVPFVPVTDKLKKTVEDGLPLYQRAEVAPAGLDTLAKPVDEAQFEYERGWRQGGLKKLRQETTAVGAARLLSEEAMNPVHRHIAERLTRVLDPAESFQVVKNLPPDVENAVGFRRYATNTYVDGYKSGSTIVVANVGESTQTVLHELTHSATANQIRRYMSMQEGNLSARAVGLTREAETACAEIVGLHKYVKDFIEKNPSDFSFGFDRYGLTNPLEFVAEAFADASFQEALRRIPALNRPDVSLWDAFLSKLRILLGLDTLPPSVLDEVIDSTSRLMGVNRMELDAIQYADRGYLSQHAKDILIEDVKGKIKVQEAKVADLRRIQDDAKEHLARIAAQNTALRKPEYVFNDIAYGIMDESNEQLLTAYEDAAAAALLTPYDREMAIGKIQHRIDNTDPDDIDKIFMWRSEIDHLRHPPSVDDVAKLREQLVPAIVEKLKTSDRLSIERLTDADKSEAGVRRMISDYEKYLSEAPSINARIDKNLEIIQSSGERLKGLRLDIEDGEYGLRSLNHSLERVKNQMAPFIDDALYQRGDELLDDLPNIDSPSVPADAKGAVQFLSDGRAVIFAFRQPDVTTVIHELGHVFRRDLPAADKLIVEGWAGVVDGVWTVEAEEKFARGFERYMAEGRSPTSALDRVFEKMKTWMREIYKTISGSSIDIDMTPEVRQVFDRLLGAGSPDNAPLNVWTHIKSELSKQGIPFNIEAGKKQIDATGNLILPTGGKVDGLEVLTTKDVSRIQARIDDAAELRKAPNQPALHLDSAKGQVVEDTAVDRARGFVEAKVPESAFAQAALGLMFGGDPDKKLRHMPGIVRKAVARGTYHVMSALQDSMRIAHESGLPELSKYLTGERIHYRAGRDVPSSGYNFFSGAMSEFTDFWQKLDEKDRRLIQAICNEDVPERLLTLDYVTKSIKKVLYDPSTPDFVKNSLNVIAAIPEKAVKAGTGPTSKERGLLRLLLQTTGQLDTEIRIYNAKASDVLEMTSKGIKDTVGDRLAIPGPKPGQAALEDIFAAERSNDGIASIDAASADRFLNTVADLYGEAAAKKMGIVLAGAGAEHRAFDSMFDAGIVLDKKDAAIFKKRLMGEHLPPKLEARANEIAQKFGLNPMFKDFERVAGKDYVVPSVAKNRLAGINRSFADEMAAASRAGEAGVADATVSAGQRMLNSIIRYMHGRMVRGGLLERQTFYLNQVVDHMNGIFSMAGLRPAIVSTARFAAQNLLVLTLDPSNVISTGRMLHTAQLATGAEIVQEGLKLVGVDLKGKEAAILAGASKLIQSGSDVFAQGLAKLLGIGKYRVEVNDVIKGGDKLIHIGDASYTADELRRIALEGELFSNMGGSAVGKVFSDADALRLEEKLQGVSKTTAAAIRQVRNAGERLFETPEEIAELVSAHERIGAYVTLIEAGLTPRTAANIVGDGLLKYGTTLAPSDRSPFVKMLVPFWPYIKNANVQITNLIFSPYGAYRLGVMRRFWSGGADMLTGISYSSQVDPYGIDESALPPSEVDKYYALRFNVEAAFGGANKVPEEVRLALRAALAGQVTAFQNGQVFEIDDYFRRMVTENPEVVKDKVVVPIDSMKISTASVPPPDKSTRSNWMRDRDLVRATPSLTDKPLEAQIQDAGRRAAEVYAKLKAAKELNPTGEDVDRLTAESKQISEELLSLYAKRGNSAMQQFYGSVHPDHPMTEILIPDHNYRSATTWMSNMLTWQILSVAQLVDRPDALTEDEPYPSSMDYVFSSTPLKTLVDPTRAPLTSDVLGYFGVGNSGGARRVHPALASFVESSLPIVLTRVPEEKDPFVSADGADGLMVAASKKDLEYWNRETSPGAETPVADDPLVTKPVRYYAGGPAATLFYNTPLGEINEKLLAAETTPYETAAGGWHLLLPWARTQLGLKTMETEQNTGRRETGKREETQWTQETGKPKSNQ